MRYATSGGEEVKRRQFKPTEEEGGERKGNDVFLNSRGYILLERE